MLLHRDYAALAALVIIAFLAARCMADACYRLDSSSSVVRTWNILTIFGPLVLFFVLYLPWMETHEHNPIANRYAQWWGVSTLNFVKILCLGSACAGMFDAVVRHWREEPYVSAESMISP